MITKIKITRLPVRAQLKLLAVAVTLDQEIHISQEPDLTIDVSDRGVPYDNFGFRLGNEEGDWSPEYKASINANINVGTPNIPHANIDIATLGNLDITANINYNNSTDRIKVESISSNGYITINGSKAIVGKTYMTYEFLNIIFIATAGLESQNAVTTIVLLPGNKDGDGLSANIILTTTGNLRGSISNEDNDTDLITGVLTPA